MMKYSIIFTCRLDLSKTSRQSAGQNGSGRQHCWDISTIWCWRHFVRHVRGVAPPTNTSHSGRAHAAPWVRIIQVVLGMTFMRFMSLKGMIIFLKQGRRRRRRIISNEHEHEHGTVWQPILEHQIRPSAPSSVISRPTCFSSSLRC